MPTTTTSRAPHLVTRLAPLVAVASLLVVGCETPPEGGVGDAIAQGSVTVTVQGAELAYLDLEGPTGAAMTDEPVLLVNLALRNDGSEPIAYDLAWSTTSSTQAQAALLFRDPGEEIVLSPAANIPLLQLAGSEYLGDPVTETTRVAPGETLTDVLLFQDPGDASGLLLSLPPSIFGAGVELPAYVRIPFSRPDEIPAPQPVRLGEAWSNDDVTFTVDRLEQAWIRLRQGEDDGFSQSPLLAVHFTIQNNGETNGEFIPVSANRSMDPPTLLDSNGAPIERVTFEDGTEVIDANGDVILSRRTTTIAPGESFSSMLLFRRPDDAVTGLQLALPGKRIGSTGLVRVAMDFAHSGTIEEPAELHPEPVEATPEDDDE